jgi:C-terminal processing protease CtpA/Prc
MKPALATLALAAATGAMVSAAVAQEAPRPGPAAEEVHPTAPVDAAEARRTATSLAAILEENYVFPDVARRYAEALRTKASAGAYDTLGSAGALADRLTDDLRAVSPDNHLRVMPGPAGDGPMVRVVRAPPGAAPPGAGPQPRRIRMPAGPPVEDARRIAPGIAYVRLNLFPGDSETIEAVRRFMADNADAKTLIFDIRTHRGGGLAEMDAIFPYLFAAQTSLVRMDTRTSVAHRHANPMGERATVRPVPTDEDVVRTEHIAIPSASEKRLFGAKVFVLTSNLSGSAAEHFALALKRTGRATLIGETTAGAGNYGGMRPIGERFSAFVPVGRTFDPDTGKGWEGTGVAPDVRVPANQALVEALVRSGLARAEAERIAGATGPQGPFTRPVPRS